MVQAKFEHSFYAVTYLDELLAEGVEAVVKLKGDDEVGGGLGQGGVLQVHCQLKCGSDTLNLTEITVSFNVGPIT